MVNEIKEAIEAGKRDREEKLREETRIAQEKLNVKIEERAKAVVRIKSELLSSQEIPKAVRSAVAKGEKSVLLSGRGGAFAMAVGELYPELKQKYESGHDHINSDEVMEDWNSLTLTWD